MNKANNTEVKLDRHDYETLLNATCKKCLCIDHLRLQLFLPFMCKVGFIKSERLYVSDYCTAAKDITTGSYSFLTKHEIPDDRHQETFFAIDEHVELQPRESLGENVSCESFRKVVAHDLFYKGEHLTHLFLTIVGGIRQYSVRLKRYGSTHWIHIVPFV